MKRLPNNFKGVLDKIKEMYTYKKMSYDEINKKYNELNIIFKENNCEVYDIDNLLNTYIADTQYTDTVTDLKKLVRDRNLKIAKKVYKSKEWYDLLNKTKTELGNIKSLDIKIKDINNGIIEIMKKYIDNWSGFWTLIKVNNNGKINDISLFDDDDNETLRKHLKKAGYHI